MEKARLKEFAARIDGFYLSCKRMPSYSEMLRLFRLRSKNAIFKRIEQLVHEGLLAKDKTGRILPLKVQRPLRLLGFVQAGFPSPAEEETVDLMSLDDYLISNPQATFLLKVDGDSMVEAGIMPQDLVLVQRDLAPRPGDIVTARVDNEWTLKYFGREKGKVILRAANKRYPPILPKEELVIGGVVIAVVRKYR